MSLVDFELEEVGKLLKHGSVIAQTRLVTCDRTLVRVDIDQTPTRKLTVCLRFPENYPEEALLVELKSKSLNESVFKSLTRTIEEHCKKELLGKPQIIPLLKFVARLLEENPLCVCYDELIRLRQQVEGTSGQLKIRQKKASVTLVARGGQYHFTLNVDVPPDYPLSRPTWDSFETNFPGVLQRFLNGQAREIVRRCVEPPLRPGPVPFEVKPSLFRALGFVVQAVSDFYKEVCPVCKLPCLPENPEDVVADESEDLFVERAFCGHLYHAKCLKEYFRAPPFTEGGKICAATSKHARPDGPGKNTVKSEGCGQKLMHDRWALDPKKAEQRWAHKKARDRELEEVVDFLK